jgi:hypothetical protein
MPRKARVVKLGKNVSPFQLRRDRAERALDHEGQVTIDTSSLTERRGDKIRMANDNKPIWHEKSGLLDIACWKNTSKIDGKDVDFYSYTFQRGYKNKEDEWENTQSLRRQDLLPLAQLLEKAYQKLGED